MKRRVMVILVCAAVVAGCLSFIVYRTLGTRAAAGPEQSLVEVVIANHDLEVGSLIGPRDIHTAKWFGPIPRGTATKAEGAINRGVVSRIYEGEPILTSRLSAAGAGGGLASTIPPGLRACAVKVNEVVGVAGFVVPGMRVDVLITGVPPGSTSDSGPHVKTLLQNIQVLSAGTNIQKDNEGKPQQVQVVNLLVTPGQAESLSLAGNEARIQLILRNPMDSEILKPPGTAMAQLFDGPAVAAPPRMEPVVRLAATAPIPPAMQPSVPALPQIRIIEVINGLTHTDARFPIAEEEK